MSFPRYPNYTASGVEWLGAVPAHWQKKPLYSSATERTQSNKGMIEDNLLSLSYGRIVRKDISSNDGLLPESFETYQIVKPGDIVIRPTDLQNDWRSLRSAIVEETGIITSAYIVVTPCGPDAKYMSYLFRTYDAMKVFYSMGGGLRQSIKYLDLKRLPIILPPLTEQTQIAAFLDRETVKIDELVVEKRRLMELLKEKRQAVISYAVTKGLNPGVPIKPSGLNWIGDVPAHWILSRVKSVSTFTTSGPRGWSDHISDEGSLFVQSGDLNDELEIEFARSKRVQVTNDAEATRTLLNDGDVVVCITGAKTGNVAVCAAAPEAAYINQHLCLIRPTEAILSAYLGVLLKSKLGQTHFELSQYGLKQGLSLEDVKEAPVLLPPKAEQTAIVTHLEAEIAKSDTLTNEAQRAIDLLQERRTSLISAAVTGQIDVRGLVELEAA